MRLGYNIEQVRKIDTVSALSELIQWWERYKKIGNYNVR